MDTGVISRDVAFLLLALSWNVRLRAFYTATPERPPRLPNLSTPYLYIATTSHYVSHTTRACDKFFSIYFMLTIARSGLYGQSDK